MQDTNNREPESSDGFWIKVYSAVVATTIVVIAALWAFSTYFR